MLDSTQAVYLARVRAVLLAIREPSELMLDALPNYRIRELATRDWQAVIDAILHEEKP